MTFTPRDRIQAVLRGEMADRVPLTIYSRMLHRGDAERQLRNQGVTPVERVYIYRVEMPNVRVTSREYYEGGLRTVHETVRTPVGEVSALRKVDPNYGSWWEVEFYIKRPQDYRVIEFMVQDSVYVPNYAEYLLAEERWGEDGYVFASTGYSPMNHMLYRLMGLERFGLDMYENPSEFFSLYELLRAKQREMFAVCAQSPAHLIQYGGNIHQDVLGQHRFREYYLPCFNEFADVMHEEGKLSLCHMDAPMDTLAPVLADSRMDVVEAFTPVPDGDMTVHEAREAWPDKCLWINFPSSVHLESSEAIREATLTVLRESVPGDRFLVGITEDIPESRWRTSLSTISHTLLEHGGLPLAIE
jgi:hypothetical protein